MPTSTTPRDESQPPKPTITAVPATPAYSTNGKYFAEMRTVSMFASYWSSFVASKRSVNEPAAAVRLHDAHALEALPAAW